jgi:hypothetical protein
LARHGALLVNSTADEILETVKEVDALASGEAERYTENIPGAAQLITQWRKSLSMPYYYGAARPSIYYLHKHASMIDQTAATVNEGDADDNIERLVAARNKVGREVPPAGPRTPTKPSAHAF